MLPNKLMMKSIDEGIRCNIIQCLAYNGAIDSERISSLIGLDPRKTRKILNMMEDEGTILLMNSGDGIIPFLSNRRQWTEQIGRDGTMTEMGKPGNECSNRDTNRRKKVDRARFELATSTMPM